MDHTANNTIMEVAIYLIDKKMQPLGVVSQMSRSWKSILIMSTLFQVQDAVFILVQTKSFGGATR
jgi:hypothetical protein